MKILRDFHINRCFLLSMPSPSVPQRHCDAPPRLSHTSLHTCASKHTLQVSSFQYIFVSHFVNLNFFINFTLDQSIKTFNIVSNAYSLYVCFLCMRPAPELARYCGFRSCLYVFLYTQYEIGSQAKSSCVCVFACGNRERRRFSAPSYPPWFIAFILLVVEW